MDTINTLLNLLIGGTTVAIYLGVIAFIILVAFKVGSGRGPKWDELILIGIILVAMLTLVREYPQALFESINVGFEASKPEINRLVQNIRGTITENYMEPPQPTIVIEDAPPTATPEPVATDAPLPTELPPILRPAVTRTPAPEPTLDLSNWQPGMPVPTPHG